MKIKRNVCMWCGACVGSCPTMALTLYETRLECEEDKCIRCRICIKVCPVGALELEEETTEAGHDEPGC